jgi:hypothetical protein
MICHTEWLGRPTKRYVEYRVARTFYGYEYDTRSGEEAPRTHTRRLDAHTYGYGHTQWVRLLNSAVRTIHRYILYTGAIGRFWMLSRKEFL